MSVFRIQKKNSWYIHFCYKIELILYIYDQKLYNPLEPNTMKDLFNSIEIRYFWGDCSILLEFSQFLDILWSIFFHKTYLSGIIGHCTEGRISL